MLGADLAFLPTSHRWLLPGAVISIALVFLTYNRHRTMGESMIGLTTALLMAHMTHARSSVGSRVLSWKPIAWIGTFSYSLYLVHSFVEIGATRWLGHHSRTWQSATTPFHARWMLLTIPPALVFSYLFHLLVEKPFMSVPRRRAEDRLASLPLPTEIPKVADMR